MAHRNFTELTGIAKRPTILAGSFGPNNTDPVDATSRTGPGFSVAYESTGLFTLTFGESLGRLMAFTATLQLATAAASVVQLGTYDSSAKTMEVRILTEDSAALVLADVAADANNRINFLAVFDNYAGSPIRG